MGKGKEKQVEVATKTKVNVRALVLIVIALVGVAWIGAANSGLLGTAGSDEDKFQTPIDIGDSGCPSSTIECGEFCCTNSEECKRRPPVVGKKFCEPITCADDEKLCSGGTRDACCKKDRQCGTDTIFGLEIAVCRSPEACVDSGSPGYCGDSKQGDPVCCPGEFEKCATSSSGNKVCVPTECFIPDWKICPGSGENSQIQICCPIGGCYNSVKGGIPICLPSLDEDKP